jgi:hypothetical protein
VGLVERYSDPDPVEGLLTRIKRQLGIAPDEHFSFVTTPPGVRPRPLYYSTAANLGLHKTRGVPSLLDNLLPASAPLTCRRWLTRLLLLPPDPVTGHAVHEACRALLRLPGPVPQFPIVSPASIALKLRCQEANETFFREARGLSILLFSFLFSLRVTHAAN